MILYSEEQHSTTFNHLLSREKKVHTELWQTFMVPLLRGKEGKINLGSTSLFSSEGHSLSIIPRMGTQS